MFLNDFGLSDIFGPMYGFQDSMIYLVFGSKFSIIQMSDWVLPTEKTNFFPSGVMLTE